MNRLPERVHATRFFQETLDKRYPKQIDSPHMLVEAANTAASEKVKRRKNNVEPQNHQN
jgi:hypothetical protein